jgi:hypothetical protein
MVEQKRQVQLSHCCMEDQRLLLSGLESFPLQDHLLGFLLVAGWSVVFLRQTRLKLPVLLPPPPTRWDSGDEPPQDNLPASTARQKVEAS